MEPVEPEWEHRAGQWAQQFLVLLVPVEGGCGCGGGGSVEAGEGIQQ